MSYFLQHRSLCLASSSPRRKELLKKFNLEFDCYAPNIDEIPNKNEQPESFVKRMAIEKGRKIHQTCLILAQDVIILAGDTIVFLMGKSWENQKQPVMPSLCSVSLTVTCTRFYQVILF